MYHNFGKTKADYSWDELTVPFKNFTQDVAIILRDIEIFNLVTTYGIECDIIIHPGFYLTQSPVAFVFQKDFALKEIIDYQLLKLMQSGILKRIAKNISHAYLKIVKHL
jgi:ABC-type amino acid transport substrate-binding protein